MIRKISSALILSLILVILIGCKDEDGRKTWYFSYYYDSRTDLCFAAGVKSITSIPCTKNILSMTSSADSWIFYYIDPKTELCMASGNHGISNVECTSEVKKLIRE